ncbi:MAG: heavy metal translocating P-type ATPase [Gemmatimonadales bacterium]|nr:heavy metal translocating P-type ATPase [Gemmatimonadales bacterium]
MRATERAAAPPAAPCSHCGLPAPGAVAERGDRRFCCAGCRTAWAILHEHGLEGYYALGEHGGRAVAPSGRSFEEFDHDTFRQLYVRPLPGGLAEVELYLEGVHCAACVWLVERVPLAIPGVQRAELQVTRSLVHVVWDPGTVALSAIARFVDRLGYRPHPFRGVQQERMRQREDRALLTQIGIAGAIATNVMLLAIAQYAGWFSGMEAEFEQFFRWWSLGLTVPALAWPGRVFFRGAWASLRTRTLHMDLPVALALAAGALRGAWNTALGTGPIYFDGVTFLIFLLLSGRYLQQRAQRGAADAAELLGALAPGTARVVEEGDAIREVPVEALLPGVTVEVRPGDTLPADGTIATGASQLDCSLLTGESRPVSVRPGDRVFAGTLNRTAPLRVHVERAGEASRLGRLLRQVEEGARRRAPVVQLADRMAGWFTALVLVLAAVTAWRWWATDPTLAIDHAMALLVVTCPCALSLATPLSVHAAIGQAARAGILIRNGRALELLARPGLLLLDKTGTVTEGRTALVAWEAPRGLRPLVLALERHATHPVARAFAEAWPDVAAPEAAQVEATAGGGITGVVEGRRVHVGSPAYVVARAGTSACWEAAAERLASEGLSPVLVAVDGAVVAAAGFGDAPRPEAAAAIARLAALGHRPALLSGDHPSIVLRVARAVGVPAADARGGASPEEKLRTVTRAAREQTVVMVGDGVNDAAAIAAASVGVGMHGGAEACLASADVFLARPGLEPLVQLVEGSRRTMTLIRALLAVSLAYNLVGTWLAMTGRIDPLIAAVLMPGTSLINIVAAWRTRTFPGRPA